MEVKTLVSIAPLGVVAVGAIFSYATLSAEASGNAEDIRDNKTVIERHTEQIAELDKNVTVVQAKVDSVQEDVSEMKADTKVILQLITNQQRRPTN
jgi:peptidoglycan hydrolase CwlO-like protein